MRLLAMDERYPCAVMVASISPWGAQSEPRFFNVIGLSESFARFLNERKMAQMSQVFGVATCLVRRGRASLEFGIKFQEGVPAAPMVGVVLVTSANFEIHFSKIKRSHVTANSPFLVTVVAVQRDLWADIELLVL
jgi:hypothetical protein